MGNFTGRWVYVSLALIVGIAFCLQFGSGDLQPAYGNQLAPLAGGANGLITYAQENEGRPTRVIIIDPQLRSMGVYEISQDKGEIELKSIRNVTADLQMLEYNNGGISPEDIQKALQRQ